MPWEDEIPEEQKSPEGQLAEGAKNVGRRGLDYGKKKAGKAGEKALEKGAGKLAEKGAEKAAEAGAEAAVSAAATPVAGAAVKAGVKAGMKVKQYTLDKIIPKKYQWACCGVSWVLSCFGGFFVVLFAAVFIFAAVQGFFKETGSATPGSTINCGFDESKLSKYEGGGAIDSLATVISPSAKNYAVNNLGISENDIKVYDPSETDDLIRQEIAKQWPSLQNKHNSTQAQAQRAILSYAHHEGGLSKFKNTSGGIVPINDSTTFSPLSITIGKYQGSKNKQYAVAWDMKYAIYLGVKENFDAFQSNDISGEKEKRWKNTIAWVFLPSQPTCYWTNPSVPCRSNVSESEWNHFKDETEYKCATLNPSPSGEFFPVVGYSGPIPGCTNGCEFGATRPDGRRHAGVDIITSPGYKVVAIKDGRVVRFFVNYWPCVDAVMIDHGDYVANYAEIRVNPQFQTVGATVKAGDELGTIIANCSGGSSMLHFELYKPGTTINLKWYGEKPDALLDPTQFLQNLLSQTKK